MPPRPKTDSTNEVFTLIAELALITRAQPTTATQVCYMLQTNPELRAAYDNYHSTWSRLDLQLAHSELAVADALRRLEGYDAAGYTCRRLNEKPAGRTHWIFAPRLAPRELPSAPARRTAVERIADALERIADVLAPTSQPKGQSTHGTNH